MSIYPGRKPSSLWGWTGFIYLGSGSVIGDNCRIVAWEGASGRSSSDNTIQSYPRIPHHTMPWKYIHQARNIFHIKTTQGNKSTKIPKRSLEHIFTKLNNFHFQVKTLAQYWATWYCLKYFVILATSTANARHTRSSLLSPHNHPCPNNHPATSWLISLFKNQEKH